MIEVGICRNSLDVDSVDRCTPLSLRVGYWLQVDSTVEGMIEHWKQRYQVTESALKAEYMGMPVDLDKPGGYRVFRVSNPDRGVCYLVVRPKDE